MYTKAITKRGNLPYEYGKLVHESMKGSSRGETMTKTTQDKKAGTKLYLGALLLLTRLAYLVIEETNQLLAPL